MKSLIQIGMTWMVISYVDFILDPAIKSRDDGATTTPNFKTLWVKMTALISINVFLFVLSFAAILFLNLTPNNRYMIAPYLLPGVSMLIFLLIPEYTRKAICLLLLLLSFLMVSNMTYHFFLTPIKFKASYTPPNFQCIYQAINRYHLQNGITGYWDATPLMSFSKNDHLNIAAYRYGYGRNRNPSPFLWANTTKWYHKYYDFMVYFPHDPRGGGCLFPYKEIIQQNVKPIKKIICNSYVLLIYSKNTLSVS